MNKKRKILFFIHFFSLQAYKLTNAFANEKRGVDLVERAISSEERIRRAEEIYNRRRMQTGVRVPSSRLNTYNKSESFPNKYKLYKKLILQIAICFVIYFIIYLIKNSNYVFSEDFISKTREFLSYDINFGNIYNMAIEYYNNNLKSQFLLTDKNEDNKESNNENITNELQGNSSVNEQVGGIGGGDDQEVETQNEVINNETVIQASTTEPIVQLSQMEIDANDIKQNHSVILPLVGTVTSRYGPRQGSEIVSSNHGGIDIGANEGTVFVSAMSGTVIEASGEGSFGNHIYIQEGDVITIYAHCKALYVKKGDSVTQGQKIGEVGQTGNATGPHLHFEIRKAGRKVNPEYVVEFA